MRAWLLTLSSVFILIGGIYLYQTLFRTDVLPPIENNLKILGVIDMDKSHTISVPSVKKGDDILLVLDYPRFVNVFQPAHPEFAQFYSQPFDILYFGSNKEGVLDNTDPLWPFLHVVVFTDNGRTYQVRRLGEAGIRAILLKHLTPEGNHTVLLSDGDERILYETPIQTQNQ